MIQPHTGLSFLKKAKYRIIGLAALVLALAWLLDGMPKQQSMAISDLILTTITGERIALKDLRGKPVIVTFWATDCPSCITEIPHLLELYRRYHPHGLELIAINMYYDPPSHVVSMARLKQLPYPVVLDLTAQHAHDFGDVQLTPSTFLIAPDGAIAVHKTGMFDLADMKSRITHYLEKG